MRTLKKSVPTSVPYGLVLVEAPPPDRAPVPPRGFDPTRRQRPYPPTDQQVRDAADVALELEASTYLQDFGHRAPDPVSLGEALRRAKGWSEQSAAADRWAEYCHAKRDEAWRSALDGMARLQPEFDLAVRHDATVADRYPQTKDFLSVRKVAAAKGAAKRSADAKAKNGKSQASAT